MNPVNLDLLSPWSIIDLTQIPLVSALKVRSGVSCHAPRDFSSHCLIACRRRCFLKSSRSGRRKDRRASTSQTSKAISGFLRRCRRNLFVQSTVPIRPGAPHQHSSGVNPRSANPRFDADMLKGSGDRGIGACAAGLQGGRTSNPACALKLPESKRSTVQDLSQASLGC